MRGMQRIGILTAGGDTPALNPTIHGAVARANQLKVEIIRLIKGFTCLFNPRVPHVHRNPLYQGIPELDPTRGGTLIGSSRDSVDPDKQDDLDLVTARRKALGIEGLICVGGDGTLNGLQPLAERLPVVLAPKTIDNDLQKNVVIVCGEAIVDEQERELGAEKKSTAPAGNVTLSGAAKALRSKMVQMIGDNYFRLYRRGDSAKEAIFTRKVGQTQRGGRPILFDRFYAAQRGADAVNLLKEGRTNAVSVQQ